MKKELNENEQAKVVGGREVTYETFPDPCEDYPEQIFAKIYVDGELVLTQKLEDKGQLAYILADYRSMPE